MWKSAAMTPRSSFPSCCRVPSQINLVLDRLTRRRFVDFQGPKVLHWPNGSSGVESMAVQEGLLILEISHTQRSEFSQGVRTHLTHLVWVRHCDHTSNFVFL